MTHLQDTAYWMAIAHLPRWRTEKINRLIVEILHSRNISFAEFFELNKSDWRNEFDISYEESKDLEKAKSELPDFSFLAENLLEQGFELIPIDSEEYSKTLKRNLKLKYSPPLLYTKGNKQLLQEPSVAIVGSRTASDASIEFVKAVAKNCAKKQQVVVSGFAKGVDRTALEGTLEAHGRSIIVLPQGIMTFSSGFKRYYSQIIEGDLLVLSTYHPKAPWSVGLAMGRNTYIYGLAEEIYVAESDSKGGTWSGVVDGLRKKRRIFVRKPAPDENNANDLLILKGAIPVDMEGRPIASTDDQSHQSVEERIRDLLSTKPLTAEEIRNQLHLEIDTQKLSRLLSDMDFITVERANNNNKKMFRVKKTDRLQSELFN